MLSVARREQALRSKLDLAETLVATGETGDEVSKAMKPHLKEIADQLPRMKERLHELRSQLHWLRTAIPS
jgi:hypothetical protein